MQDRNIKSALLSLRKQITQGDGEGLEHVEALLRQRGVPMGTVPRPRMKAAGKGVMTYMVLEALQDGPQTARYVSEYISARRPELPFSKAHQLTGVALTKLKGRGLVAREDRLGGLWWVVQDFGAGGCLWLLS